MAFTVRKLEGKEAEDVSARCLELDKAIHRAKEALDRRVEELAGTSIPGPDLLNAYKRARSILLVYLEGYNGAKWGPRPEEE